MPILHLTDLSIAKLAPCDPPVLYTDRAMPGFGIRVGKTTKTFIVVLGARERRKLSLGQYPSMSLKDARRRARELQLAPTVVSNRKTFEEAVAAYEIHLDGNYRPRPAKEVKRHLNKHCTHLFARPLTSITKSDLMSVFETLASTPSEANHLFGVLRTFFAWCERRDYLDRSPLTKLAMPYRAASRSRVLSDDELRRIWAAADPFSRFGRIIRICMLSGLRRGEVAAIEKCWLADRTLTVPGGVEKNGLMHTLPLPPFTASMLAEWVPICVAKGSINWSAPKLVLDKVSGVTDWVIHDLRRTFATIHGRIGTPVHITERLLNHVSGTHGGIVGVYQRYEYQDECRAAMEKYEFTLLSIVGQGETRRDKARLEGM